MPLANSAVRPPSTEVFSDPRCLAKAHHRGLRDRDDDDNHRGTVGMGYWVSANVMIAAKRSRNYPWNALGSSTVV